MITVNNLKAQINAISSKIWEIEHNTSIANSVILAEEIANFLDGVGADYVKGDYYASDRYTSRIKGVKNIRGGENTIFVKITSPAGKLIPSSIVIGDKEIPITIMKSNTYSREVDY